MITPPATLQTPAAVLDVPRLERNIQRMQGRMNALGVRLRPHVKTSKCLPVIAAQIAAGATGVTVSTLGEAQRCFEHGIDDILYAVAMAPDKLPQALDLARRGCRLGLLTDSLQGAQAISRFASEQGQAFEVWIEIDCDGHRAGLRADDPALLAVARVIAQGQLSLAGVLTHAGSSYALSDPQALAQLAEQERLACVTAAERLRAAGLPCPEVSVGSTPTALSARELDGVTEVRAGVYAFFDLVMYNIGVCQAEELALSVLTQVIGHQPDKGWIIVDAGWMAMSRDRGTQHQQRDFGYGQVCTQAGHWIDGMLLSAANQEHGIVTLPGLAGAELARQFPLGTRLRILPNHACATGAQFPHYQAISACGEARPWSRLHGW